MCSSRYIDTPALAFCGVQLIFDSDPGVIALKIAGLFLAMAMRR